MFNTPRGDLTRGEVNNRLAHTTPAEKMKAADMTPDPTIMEHLNQAKGHVGAAVLALIVAAGGIAALDQVAQKYAGNYPTVDDVQKWADSHLHGNRNSPENKE